MPVSPWEIIKNMSLRCTVKINGTEMKEEYGIESISISHKIGTISSAELSVTGNYSSDFSSLSVADDEIFTPGNLIEITGGYDDKGETVLFNGCIVSYSVQLSADQPVSLKLSCKHNTVKMTMEKKTRTFENKTDSAIISGILSENSVKGFSVESTSIENKKFSQTEATDWDIVLSRAEENGFIVCLDADSISIKLPAISQSPVLRLASGESILDFSGELIAEHQPSTVEGYGYDDKQALLKVTAKEPSVNDQGNLQAKALAEKFGGLTQSYFLNTPTTTADLESFVNSKLLRTRLSAIRGSVSFIGSPLVKTGGIIQLEGVGKRYNGSAYVSAVSHSINKGIWKTTAKFGLDIKPISKSADFSGQPANGQVPVVHGLRTARVIKLAQDTENPDSLYKVLVALPSATEEQNTVWARMANFYATSGAGLEFLPEVGDEVAVAFVDSNPNNPIILGALFGAKNVAPNPAADENNFIKRITTKSKLKISFDDENKVIQIETPAANRITISEQDDKHMIEVKDNNNNLISMTADGIKISSDKDIILDAKGSMKLSAVGKITLSSNDDVAISGNNIKSTALVGFTAKGSTAEVSASGPTTIKGAMVMIN